MDKREVFGFRVFLTYGGCIDIEAESFVYVREDNPVIKLVCDDGETVVAMFPVGCLAGIVKLDNLTDVHSAE